MIAYVCISLVSALIGLAISVLPGKIWAVLVMSFAIVAMIAVFALGGHVTVAGAIALAVLALSFLQAGYLAGGLSSGALNEREDVRSPRALLRLKVRGLPPAKNAEKI